MLINELDTSQKVCEMVTEDPSRANIFDRYQIDYCCGGNVSLKEICLAQGIDLRTIVAELKANDEKKMTNERINLNNLSLTELTGHIEQIHHNFLKRELPYMENLLIKVMDHHQDPNLNLNKLHEVFLAFTADILNHMDKEEHILFPTIRQIDTGDFDACVSHCGSIRNPIAVMISEHDTAKEFLLTMRKLSNDYTPPESACTTFRTLFQKLYDLELDMHRHVHKENHILFPKAIEKETAQNS